MSRLNFSELIDAPVLLSPTEAAALTLAVADAVREQAINWIPPDEELFLSSTGQVSLGQVIHSEDGDTTVDALCTQLAALTRRLLQLDKPGTVDRRRRVPGGLLVLLARAMGQIDLSAPTPEEFRQGLERVATPDATTLAAVFWRAARLRAPARSQVVSLPAVKVESALAHRGADDRRHNTPPSSELRRYLRETERELFEARVHPDRRQQPIVVIPPPPRRPFTSTRLWRVGSGIAATVIGAVLGTFMAFILAGSIGSDRPDPMSQRSADGESPAMASVDVRPASAKPTEPSKGQRPIRTERTVQPLLLAAAVGADLFSPSFGPHGRALLFHAGRDAAPLMRALVSDTGEVEVDQIETLLDDGAANYHVTMSPDAARIAYDSDRDGVRGVYVANSNGSSPHRISGSGYAAVPSWSPDGQRVAFVREEPGHRNVWNVWIADVRTGLRRRVTSHVVGQPWGASWFPDGRRLAYSLEDRLMVADLQSGLARGYRSPREGRLVRTPAVSPDGKQIVFQVQRDGVWLLDVERARMRRILADATAEEFVWLPDGAAIAYHARQGGSYGLFRLALNTSGN
jgi:hypothetical protein